VLLKSDFRILGHRPRVVVLHHVARIPRRNILASGRQLPAARIEDEVSGDRHTVHAASTRNSQDFDIGFAIGDHIPLDCNLRYTVLHENAIIVITTVGGVGLRIDGAVVDIDLAALGSVVVNVNAVSATRPDLGILDGDVGRVYDLTAVFSLLGGV